MRDDLSAQGVCIRDTDRPANRNRPLMPEIVAPADRYLAAAGLWAVTAYFNPHRYRTRHANYQRFRAPFDAGGLPLLTVECAFSDEGFELPAAPDVLHVRGRDVMWQKERLLNAALPHLPSECTAVVWIDGDVLFQRDDWAPQTQRLLQHVPVVQPFAQAIRLPRGATAFDGDGDVYDGFAATYARRPQLLLRGDFAAHGHTGFAWAARRDLLDRHSLYDACIAGSGDHVMAHAFCGDWSSRCLARVFGDNGRHKAYFRDWCRRVYPDVRARLSFVPGALLHLWHGEIAARRYVTRNQELAAFGFDPVRDLRVGATGCWEWAGASEELRRWAYDYFTHRQEDGPHQETP
jgi:hypothetical protein